MVRVIVLFINPVIQALNAYEFERHAGAKTKHPNNHIYFENGKTIYAVVQELKNTPQEMLFDSIQNVTGSTINQKNFRIWKGDESLVCLVVKKLDRQCILALVVMLYIHIYDAIFSFSFPLSASYQAATRELQRIYGKDEVIIPS